MTIKFIKMFFLSVVMVITPHRVVAEDVDISVVGEIISDGFYVVYPKNTGRKTSVQSAFSSGEKVFTEAIIPKMIEDMELRIASGKIFISFDLQQDFESGASGIIIVRNSVIKFFTIQIHQINDDVEGDGRKTFYLVENISDQRAEQVLQSCAVSLPLPRQIEPDK